MRHAMKQLLVVLKQTGDPLLAEKEENNRVALFRADEEVDSEGSITKY